MELVAAPTVGAATRSTRPDPNLGALINFLVLMTLLFGGLAKTASLPPRLAWGIAIGCAVVAMTLAIVRYVRTRG